MVAEVAAERAAYRDVFAVAEFRDFWLLFLEWSRLAVSGSVEVICSGEEIEQAVTPAGSGTTETKFVYDGWNPNMPAGTPL